MRLAAWIPAVFAATAVWAAGEFDFLPETVASVNGEAITREMVVARMRNSGVSFAESSRATLVAAAKSAAETEIYFYLLGRLMAAEGVAPSEKAAQEKLVQLEKAVPNGMPDPVRSELRKLASSEHFRWNVALQEYLGKVAPETIAVSPVEIEQRYRINQEQFRLPEQYQLGVIRVRKNRPEAREIAENTRARLLQGEQFDRVAAEVDPDGELLPDAEILDILKQGDPSLPAGSVSRILENDDAYFIIKIKSKSPGRFVPLEQLTPYLRLQLASEKAGRVLELLLRGELRKANIQFFIEQE